MGNSIINLFPELLQIFGVEFINVLNFFELLVRFTFNFLVVLILVRFLYYPLARRKEYFFSFILVSTIVFLVTYSLVSIADLSTGVAIGLFALFGILRFRTRQIPVKEMTYLFLVIGISVINAMLNDQTSYVELLFINMIILFVAWAAELFWQKNTENSKFINYEKIDLISPDKKEELIADLKKRTGLNITDVEIGRINFMRDTVRIRIFFCEEKPQNHFEDGRSIR
ncbi:MAG: DUF4956 domain-containing protein [Bacteroidales bacterium]|nr:DUF4956 domain-containing protein [Bacteroidales bacterium]